VIRSTRIQRYVP